MAIDSRRVLRAAIEAALEDPAPPPRKRRLTSGRALLLGAGLMTAGKFAIGPRGRDALDSLRQRISELEESLAASDEEP